MRALALAVLLCGSAHAADAPAASAVRSFEGGLNNFNASIALNANESPNLMNVVIDDPVGALTQRNGYLTCGTIPSGNTATNLYEYAKQNGTRYLIVTDNESVWQTVDCVVFSTITSGQSATALPRFATARDNLWIVNGSTYPLVWNGTTLSRLDGLGGRPEAPRGKYITYWKNRVWIANTPTDPSILNFSALVDATGALLDPATSTSAWVATNAIYFNRGETLYGIKVYRDNLYAFEENAISRLVFESEYTANGITVSKNVSRIGSKFQESIVEMDDGLLRYAGRDGSYAFDGVTPKRLSTRWTPTYESILQPSIAEQYKTWDTPTDWLAGSPDINVSTIPNPDSISLGYEDFADGNYTANPAWEVTDGSFAIDSGRLKPTGTGTNNITLPLNKFTGDFSFKIYISTSGGSGNWYPMANTKTFATDIKNGRYKLEFTFGPGATILELDEGTASGSRIVCSTTGPSIVGSTITISLSLSGANATLAAGAFSCSGSRAIIASSSTYTRIDGNGFSADDFTYVIKSTGIFTSEITTATSISAWRTFDVDPTLNGQTITYDVRTGSTVYNTGLAAWSAFSPGAVISTTTNGFVQWRANFSTSDNSVTPVLNSAVVGWLTGGSSKSTIYGINYKSRYWMSAATTASTNYNDLVMVESKTPLYTHTRYNLPVSAFTLWNGNLYGSISNTAKIARLDYGSTDDGSAITSYWDSRDEIYDNPILYKSINRQIADFASTPSNSGLKIGLSNDLGGTWSYKTINTGVKANLPRNTTVVNQDANRALQFRSRVYNDTLGIGFKLYGLFSFGTVGNFYGN